MRASIKLSEGFLSKMAAYSPSIHEDIEEITKDIEMDEVRLKRSNIPGNAEFKIDKSEERTTIGMSSTRHVDRHREIVVPKGVDLTQFRKAPVKLWNHDHNKVIGKNPAIKAVRDGILSKTVFAPIDDAVKVFELIKFGAINTNSIGFIPTKVFRNGQPGFGTEVDNLKKVWDDFTTKMADSVTNIISKSILLEDSVAPVPANIDARLMAVSEKNMDYVRKSLEDVGINVEIIEEVDEIENELEAYYKSLSVEKNPERKNAADEEKVEKNIETKTENDNNKVKSNNDPLSTIRLISSTKLADPRLAKLKAMTKNQLIEWKVRQKLGIIR